MSLDVHFRLEQINPNLIDIQVLTADGPAYCLSLLLTLERVILKYIVITLLSKCIISQHITYLKVAWDEL